MKVDISVTVIKTMAKCRGIIDGAEVLFEFDCCDLDRPQFLRRLTKETEIAATQTRSRLQTTHYKRLEGVYEIDLSAPPQAPRAWRSKTGMLCIEGQAAKFLLRIGQRELIAVPNRSGFTEIAGIRGNVIITPIDAYGAPGPVVAVSL